MSYTLIRNILRSAAAFAVACCIAMPAAADVLVFGGTRGVGLETVRLIAGAGEPVTVLVRETSDLTALQQIAGVRTVVGDAMQPEAITEAYASGNFAVVVSTLSGNAQSGFVVDSVGNINAIQGAKDYGVRHFILVSSIGVGKSVEALPPPALKALAAVLAEKTKAEIYLAESGLKYTIIRPGALTDKPANGLGVLSEDPATTGIISRAEVARLLVETMGNKNAYGKVYAAVEQKKPKAAAGPQ